ncbi:MAG: hypothetical protein ACI9K5_003240 [Gammaproteobacteria bacterium]|jgi:hypothetical protein
MGRIDDWRIAPKVKVRALLLPVLLAGFAGACREGEDQQGASFIPLGPPSSGNHGCATANQDFSGGGALTAVDMGGFITDAFSRMAAAADSPLLYVTGASAEILELDVTDPAATVARSLVGTGVIDALLVSAGIVVPAQLSGVAVIDAGNLVVVEHSSNTLLLVDRLVPDTVAFFAGLPSSAGGYADGAGGQIRFSFEDPTAVVPTASGQIFVADSGNHVIRRLFVGAVPQSETVAGTGAPGFLDGNLGSSQFDTPTGLSISCDGRLLVTETGAAGQGGNRLRALSIGSRDFFGNLTGMAVTLAGSGVDASSEGIGEDAELASPGDVFSTNAGEIYFVDGSTGHARRYAVDTGLVDCAFGAVSCVATMGNLSGAENVGLTASSNGDFFFLLGDLSSLLFFDPS